MGSKRKLERQNRTVNGKANDVKEMRVRFDHDKPSLIERLQRGADVFVAYRGFGW